VFYGTAGLTDGSGLLLFAIGREAPGLSFVDSWDTMAMRGTGSWDVVFDDVFVPELMGQVGAPWEVWDRRAESMLSWFVCTLSAVYLGLAEAAARFAFGHVATRRLGGMEHPLGRQPGMIFAAGEVDAQLRAARALLFDTIRRRRDQVLPPAEVVAVKYVITNAAVAAVERCFRMVGGSAIYRRLPMERMFRDVQAGPLHPPTNDLALEGLGREALGIPPDSLPRWGNEPAAAGSASQTTRGARMRAPGRSSPAWILRSASRLSTPATVTTTRTECAIPGKVNVMRG
jgi:alkylation response protein AidB-like acyl-CoA dehydrogenase